MLHWCRWIKTLWWEGIICSLVSKQIFISDQPRKTFVRIQVLQADKMKHSNRGEMINLFLKSQLLKVSDNNNSCSWDSTRSVCTLAESTLQLLMFCHLQGSNASSEKTSNAEEGRQFCMWDIWQYSTTELLLLHRAVVDSREYSRAAMVFPWRCGWSD